MLAYALTIFTGAFLLFQVQPLIGKYILPWFGGGPGVWTTCLLFFQTLLLGGYAYAHVTARFLKPRAQAALHLVLLAAALALLPITPGDAWKPSGDGNPTAQILVLLIVSLGLPYFVLSSTGPLMQHWFSRTRPGVSPYRLYALSNVGSLLALVSYPFFFEPQFTRQAQAALWACGLGVYAVCCGFCAVKLWRANPADESRPLGAGDSAGATTPLAPNPPPPTLNRLLWLLLPACGSALLLAFTNKMCQDVAVIPFLWVLPLALYLLSFILCFDSPRWYARPVFGPALIVALVAVCWALFEGIDAPLRAQVVVYSVALFVCCMVCHGELYRLRPDPRHLTGFYLMIAAGGALGGAFVAVIAPRMFTDYHELHWGLLACGLLFLVVCLRERTGDHTNSWRGLACVLTLLAFGGLDQALVWLGAKHAVLTSGRLVGLRIGLWGALALIVAVWMVRGRIRPFRFWRGLACAWLAAGLVTLAGALWVHARQADDSVIAKSRNFYGTLKLCEYHKDDPASHYLLLQHGRITHGFQFTDPDWSRRLVSYYSEGSGIALAVNALPSGPRRLGVVGLGTGTMAAFGRAGDTVRLYEINPQVQQLAVSRFTYLRDSPARTEVVMGDARLSLECEPPQQFDLLAMDAFSSDAVPVHLLTKEAFEVYDRHLKPGGIIAVHISNRYIDLEPVVVNVARHFNYRLALIHFEETDGGGDDGKDWGTPWWMYASSWVLLTRNEEILSSAAIRAAASEVKTNAVRIPLWTDDFASVFQLLQ